MTKMFIKSAQENPGAIVTAIIGLAGLAFLGAKALKSMKTSPSFDAAAEPAPAN